MNDQKRICGIVIGSVHVDVFADVYPEEVDGSHIDKRGFFTVSVGGTGFNVATNMANLGVNVHFFTAIKRGSLFSRLVSYVLNLERRFQNYVLKVDSLNDSGFFAVRQNGELVMAVTSTVIENISMDFTNYEDLFEKSDFIVVDMNNSIETIENVFNVAEKYDKQNRVYLLGTSEIKAKKLVHFKGKKAGGVILNMYEAVSVLQEVEDEDTKKYFRFNKIIDSPWFVTNGSEPVKIYLPDQIIYVPVNKNKDYVSTSGSGDAFTAGVICRISQQIADNEPVDYKKAASYGIMLAQSVMNESHANMSDNTVLKNIDFILYRDPLTELYTRRFYEEEKPILEGMIQRKKSVISVAVFDLDKFKSINDTYGHDVGDEVLRMFGSIIKNSIRKSDIPIRWGGEEIVVLFPNTTEDKAQIVAEKIRKRLEDTSIKIGKHTLNVTVSAGISEGTDIEKTIKQADEALYRAKNSGRNRVVMYSTISRQKETQSVVCSA